MVIKKKNIKKKKNFNLKKLYFILNFNLKYLNL